MKKSWVPVIGGILAGAVNGLLGAGGGMVLVPVLSKALPPEEGKLFPTCVAVMLPMCLVSVTVYGIYNGLPWAAAWPYLVGSGAGGLLAGRWGSKLPTTLLRLIFGGLMVWGGIRGLCS